MAAYESDTVGDNRKKRFLIVVGLPKSGTTFIYSQLQGLTDHFNLPSAGKEIDYFRRGQDFGDYMRVFSSHGDKVYLDASPLYLDDVVGTSQRIVQCLSGHDVKILVCLRGVYERIYSHYLHDIAQNFQIFGHGRYSFTSPAVMAKYLYPTSDRIRHLIDTFGRDNVFGFSFAAANDVFASMLRDFARLPPDWDFDFTLNPAPGFTAPSVHYDSERDTAVTIGGLVYLLPAGSLLVVNRQFSLLNPSVDPGIGQRLFENQALIQRSFDPTVFPAAARDRIEADQQRSLELLHLAFDSGTTPGLLYAHASDELPSRIQGRLQRIDSLDDLVSRIYDNPLSPSTDNILMCPEPSFSLAKAVAEISIAASRSELEPLAVANKLEQVIREFGPIPVYLSGLVREKLRNGLIGDIEALIAPYGDVSHLMVPIEIASYVRDRKLSMSEDDIRRLAAVGLRMR